ncbi:ornithine cyclodeaminase family protein [Paenibacillus sp. N1-5-1-14]|uniref:ornithine cyclodeaminase family protein n=1 Tax=Paenibacillus radicibacter TaxID=2972488 RepID=UPI0021594168|nr:ornithine cyclodeaminase family protein [Paenibacillus radicibacter]MCR8644773.1 ornithine cyclodeaminase family protein [Paenibacillus radicibacter]
MLVLTAQDQAKLVQMDEVIEAVSIALAEYSSGRAIAPIRMSIPVDEHHGTALFMPSLVAGADSLGVKFVSVFPDNKRIGKKTIYGLMILSDMTTGEPLAILEASYLTVIRTGAASGLATKLLARENAKVLGVIGTGAQSKGMIEAVRCVRKIEEVRLYNRSLDKAHALAAELREEAGSEHLRIIVVEEADQAVQGSDIVLTATNSSEPVFSAGAISPGLHVNAIGSFRPQMQELPSALIAQASKVVVESIESALDETGDLLIPIAQGVFSAEHIHAELGEIVNGLQQGRDNEDEITVFKSVGLAVMDVVVAKLLYDRAMQVGIGQQVNL